MRHAFCNGASCQTFSTFETGGEIDGDGSPQVLRASGRVATTCALQADHVAAEVRKVQFKRLEKEAEAEAYEVIFFTHPPSL